MNATKVVVGRCLLSEKLREKGWTKTQLADFIGKPKQQISDYDSMRQIMSLPNAMLIAKALGCHIDDLYEFHFESE